MSINKTGIGWCTHSWNVMTGCNHNFNPVNPKFPQYRTCPNCYACQTAENKRGTKAFPNGFDIAYHEDRLQEPEKFKKPAIIFMDSMSDTFGSWWTDNQISKVFTSITNAPWHRYVCLTKNPSRMADFLIGNYGRVGIVPHPLETVWFGTSISGGDTSIEYQRILELERVSRMGYNTVLSIEPLTKNPRQILARSRIHRFSWIIIGGQTGPTFIPPWSWIQMVLSEAIPDNDRPKPVYIKHNAGPGHETFKYFPDNLLPIAKAWGKA